MKRYKILAVEDDDDTFIGLNVALSFSDYEVIRAEDGTMAVQLLAKCDIDLVLLDLGLPAGDGYFVLDCIKRHRSSLPVIVVSAQDSVTNMRKAMAAGAASYIEKPVNIQDLLSTISANLSERQSAAMEEHRWR